MRDQKGLSALQMNYMKSFQCTCGDCPDSCCIGWDVDIDQETYSKYMHLENPTLKKRYQRQIKPYPYAFDPAVDYARVKLPHSKRCPFLTDKGLCITQCELGESYLSNVCATFPRMTNRIDGTLETTLTLACPVAAELVLCATEPLKMQTCAIPSRYIVNLDIQTKASQFKQHPVSHFHLIRQATLDILNQTNLPFETRIFGLGQLFEQLESCQRQKRISQMPKVISVFLADWPESYEETPLLYEALTADAIKCRFFDIVVETLQVYETLDSKKFIAYTRTLHEQLNATGKRKKTDPKAFSTLRTAYSNNFNTLRTQVLTQYAINYVYKNCFPFTESENLFEAYSMLVLRLALIDFYAVGLSSEAVRQQKTFTIHDFATLVQTFAKAVEHHKSFSEGLMNHFRENDQFNLIYLSQLMHWATL